MSQQKRVSTLDGLSKQQRDELVEKLHTAQNGLCYVCEGVINRQVHKADIDHIVALARDGRDEESNWALAHDSCNRSKGTRDLQLQRILHEFRKHRQKYTSGDAHGQNRNFTLNEALLELTPERQEVGAVIQDSRTSISWTENEQPQTETYPILDEPANPPARSFVARIPRDPLKAMELRPQHNGQSV